MTRIKIVGVALILSAAVATPVLARSTHHGRSHFRGAYNQMIEPSYATPRTHGGWNLENYEFNHSFPGGEDPSDHPSGS
jgi:hypothetical protein